MNFRLFGERIDRLEADAEPPDAGQLFLGAFRNAAHAPDVGLVKGLAVVGDGEGIVRQRKVDGAGAAIPAALFQGILGVLQHFVNKMRPIIVAVGQQHPANALNVGAVLPFVFPADSIVV